MKRIILIAAAAVLCSGIARAESGIDEVRAELKRAVAAGEITRDDAKALMRDAIDAHRAERHARRDAKHADRDVRKAERDARKAERKSQRDAAGADD
jgi:polyhydroxyalkanoate synthesis regulator phasin